MRRSRNLEVPSSNPPGARAFFTSSINCRVSLIRSFFIGELLRQTGGGESLDEIRLFLSSSGGLVLALAVGDLKIEESVGNGLNDGRWHTVVLRVGDDTDDVTVSVTHGDASSTATIGQNELGGIVRNLDLRSNNPQLRVGAGLVGCIREGPGVRFTKSSAPVNSVAVAWGRCLLPETCSGRTTNLVLLSCRHQP